MKTDVLTRIDLSRALGEVDEVIAAQLLSVGATLPELWTAVQLVDHESDIPDHDTEAARVVAVLKALHVSSISIDDREPEYLGTD